MATYLQIVKDIDNEVVKEFDITGWTDKRIERLETGLLRQINLNEFHTQISHEMMLIPLPENDRQETFKHD